MTKYRKQIKDSFFNPILHFLPLFVFLIIEEYGGTDIAWKLSFPVAMLLVFYVYVKLNKLFNWHILFTALYVVVGVTTSLVQHVSMSQFAHGLQSEIILILVFIALIIFRKSLQHFVLSIMDPLLPMTNNFNEVYRSIYGLLLIIILHVISSVVMVSLLQTTQTESYLQFARSVYSSAFAFLLVYELLRVAIIRSKLIAEEWWPIVNEHGKIVGRIQQNTSLQDEKKYMHPVIRVLLIDKGMILLQKHPDNHFLLGGLWDAAISNHLLVGETLEESVTKTARESYGLENFKYMHLSNYSLENKFESHYAFLFVSCQQTNLQPNKTLVENIKWWTQQQIEANLNAGIFTQNFITEYDLVKRSGILDTDKCVCKCRLKDTIYEQSGIKKDSDKTE